MRIGGLPSEVLRHVFAGIVGSQRRGAQRQIAGTDVDFRPFAAHQGDLDRVSGDSHRHQAVIGEPVVGNGGDDGRAVADAGDHAVFNGRDVRVAGLPGEVGGRMVGSVAGRAVGAQRHSLADEQMFAVGNVEAGDRHHDGDGDLAAHAGAVLGGGVDLGAAGAHAAHRAGAVGIGAHLDDVPIAGAPGEVLADVQIVAISIGRHGAQHQVAGTDVDVGALRVHRLDGDLAGRHRHRNDADLGEAVVGSGGDGGRADAGGGQFALSVDGDDVLIAAPPSEVGGRVVGGVGGSAAELELLLLADEQLHHFRINIEALHRHDDAHGDLAENAGAVGGVGINLHSAGSKAGHGAGAVAVGVHAGIARVGGFPGEVLLYAVGGAVRAVGGSAQRQIAGADGHLGLVRVHGIDDDRAHGIGDLHQASGRAVVERARDQAHLARLFAREVAAGVNACGAGHRFHRPEDGAGLGVRGGDGGGEALALADDNFPGRRQRHGGGHLGHVDLYAHGVERAGPGGDGHRAGSTQRLHERAGLGRGHGGDARVAGGPGDGQIEHFVRADLQAERGVLVKIKRIVRIHRGVVIVENGAQNRRIERHFRAKDRAGRDLAAFGAKRGDVIVAELCAFGVPAQAGVAAGEHPAVEQLAIGRFRRGQLVGGLGRHRGKRAATQQLVIAAVEGDDHALFALLRLGGGGVERGQIQTRLAGGGNGLAVRVKAVDGRGVRDQGRVDRVDEGVERQRAGREQRAVRQLPAGKDHVGAGAERGQLYGVALAEQQRLREALVAQEQFDGIGRLHLRAFRIGAVAGEAHGGRQHQAGKAALVKGGVVHHVVEAHRGGIGGGEHALFAGIPAVDGAAGAESGEIIAKALAGVVIEYVIAIAFVGLIAAGKGDGLVGAVLVNAHARARARPGAGVEHDFDHTVLRLTLEDGREIDFHRGQAVVEHDAGHGDHLQNLVVGKAGGFGVDQRTGAGGGVVVAAHIVLKAPTDQHLAFEQRVDDREGYAFAAGGKAHVFLIALGVGDGDVEYDGLFRIGGDDQRRAQGEAVGGHRFGLRARVDERLKLGIADRSLAGRPALAARKRPAGARHAVRQRIGKGNIRIAGGERHRADGLAAVGEQQLQVRLVGLGRAVGGVVGAHFQALVAALGHRQAGGHSAEALHQLFIGKRGAGLKLDAIQIRAAVDAAPIDGIPLPLRQLRDGLGTLALIQAHAGKLFQRPILIAGMLIEGEDDAVFAVALDIHVNAIGVGAGFLAKRMRFAVSQRRLAHGQFARKLAVRAGQNPGRAFGQHVGQGVRRFRIFGRERQRRGVDALLLVLSLSMIEIDMIDRQLVFDLIGRAQVDDDGAEIVGRLAHVGAGQIVKGHLALFNSREGKGIAIAAEALPTGMRVSLVRGQRRQGDV